MYTLFERDVGRHRQRGELPEEICPAAEKLDAELSAPTVRATGSESDRAKPLYADRHAVAGRTNLAKPGWLERSCLHEILGLEREEPSFDHARHSHSSRGDSRGHNRAARPDARGLLGRDRDLGRDAIEPRRDPNALD